MKFTLLLLQLKDSSVPILPASQGSAINDAVFNDQIPNRSITVGARELEIPTELPISGGAVRWRKKLEHSVAAVCAGCATQKTSVGCSGAVQVAFRVES
jgi:hypothetical protein